MFQRGTARKHRTLAFCREHTRDLLCPREGACRGLSHIRHLGTKCRACRRYSHGHYMCPRDTRLESTRMCMGGIELACEQPGFGGGIQSQNRCYRGKTERGSCCRSLCTRRRHPCRQSKSSMRAHWQQPCILWTREEWRLLCARPRCPPPLASRWAAADQPIDIPPWCQRDPRHQELRR